MTRSVCCWHLSSPHGFHDSLFGPQRDTFGVGCHIHYSGPLSPAWFLQRGLQTLTYVFVWLCVGPNTVMWPTPKPHLSVLFLVYKRALQDLWGHRRVMFGFQIGNHWRPVVHGCILDMSSVFVVVTLGNLWETFSQLEFLPCQWFSWCQDETKRP